jgi:DNA-binding NtrC family response regulator
VPKVPFRAEDDALPTVATVRETRAEVGGIRVSVVTGPDAGLRSAEALPRAIVGRANGADVVLGDAKVSAFHLELSATPSGVEVKDLQSRNGSYYQGARLDRGAVASGALLTIGDTTLRVELESGSEQEDPELLRFGSLRGASASMFRLFGLLSRLARTELSVLIEGPTGVGKELAARGLHAESLHAEGPFVVLDCTAIPATLAESVLFGHEKGAFTGATEARPGVFEAAGAGTIFLDEVGELALELQAKLLRVLEQREVVRVGSVKPRAMAARVLCATWRDLRERVNTGHFREDLYYRLTQARVVIPPLRERPDDIPVLVEHFLGKLPSNVPCAHGIDAPALAELMARDYPGNVRELRNVVERAAMTAESDTITPSDLAFERLLSGETQRASVPPVPSVAPADASELVPFKDAKRTLIEDFERGYLSRLLERAGNNLSKASTLARIERHYLRDLLRKHGLRPSE